jgi:DNA-binding CsgD family transcriptional regulator
VGREAELVELTRRLGAARTRGADGVLVLGAPGLGKTALLRELAQRAEQREAAVLRASAAPWEEDDPGAVVRQLIQEAPSADPTSASDQLAESIVTALEARPTTSCAAVLIDDADHADEFSMQAITSTVRRHRGMPVLVVLAARRATAELDGLATDAIRIDGLDASAVAELAVLRGRVLHPAIAEQLTRHTAGNPRDVLTLLEEVAPESWTRPDSRLPAPRHVVTRVADQLRRCTDDTRALVEALAILGEQQTLGAAGRLARLDDPLAALDEAEHVGLLRPRPYDQPQLRDPLVVAAVVEQMGVGRAAETHRRAAVVVDEPAERLRHRVAATLVPDAELADEVERLARERGSQGAWAQAARLFRDASRLTVDPVTREDRLIRSVDALVATGDGVGASAMVPAVESMRETPLRNAVLAYLAIIRGRAAEADVRLRRALDIVNPQRDSEIAALIAQRHVLDALARCRGAELVRWADQAIALAGQESAIGVEAAAIRGLGLAIAGRTAEAAQAYEAAADVAGRDAQAQRVSMGRGWLSVLNDDLDDARSRLESVTRSAPLGGSARITLWALGWLSRVQFLTGEWDQVLHTVEEGRALAADTGIVLATPLLEWTAAQVHALRGHTVAAHEAARAADSLAQGYEIMQVPALLARAQLAETTRDHAAVRRILEPLTRVAPGTALSEPSFWPWADLFAHALVTEGRLDEADDFLRPHEQRARGEGHRSATARLGSARARLLAASGDTAGSGAAFDEALRLLDGLPLRYDRARITFAYGQTLRRAGRRRDAATVLRAARDLWEALGAQALVDECDRELKAGGARPVGGARAPEALTPQEETVAELVAAGLANREVAARLYVSPKTVQYHLTRIYAKLGVRSRTELAARHGDAGARQDDA